MEQSHQSDKKYFPTKPNLLLVERMMNLPTPAHYKNMKQGGKILLCPQGFEFSKSKSEASRVHYVCRKKFLFGCKVTAAVTTKDNMLVRISGDHNHDNDIAKKNIEFCIERNVF